MAENIVWQLSDLEVRFDDIRSVEIQAEPITTIPPNADK